MKLISVAIVACVAVIRPVHSSGLFGRVQSAGVVGTLMCGSKALINTPVKLWDADTDLEKDDLLGITCTDSLGRFNISGFTREMTNIDVSLRVYTDCNDKALFGTVSKPCQRIVKLPVPDLYTNDGEAVHNWYDFGIMNMEVKQADEDRDCAVFELC